MKLRVNRPAWTVVLALALSGLVSCILEAEKTSKRGSEVENEVYGILVALDGKPVAGAKVKAVPALPAAPKRGAAAADSDSVVTDANGRYAFQDLEAGRYNLFGDYESGNLVVLIPEVERSDTSQPQDIGVDTLRAPGRIRGRLLLGDAGKGGVLAYVPGTSYLAVSDESGRFVIGGVPQGSYRVNYSAPGFVIAPDTGVAVLSGKTTDLPVKRLAHDPALPPPAPTGLKAVYDTLNERVLLSWDPVPVADLDGYVIYRDKPSFLDPQVVKDGFTRATSFLDSLPGIPMDQEAGSLVYRIKSRDKELNQSVSFSSPVEVSAVSKQWVSTRMGLEVSGIRDGVASPGDTVRLILTFSNPTRKIRTLEWRLAGVAEPLRVSRPSALSGQDTLAWISGQPGPAGFEAKAFDEAGDAWNAATTVSVVPDRPTVFAGRDTVVSLGDTVRLRGNGSDAHGRVVAWAWDIGATGSFRAGRDTAIEVPRTPLASFLCILRATDDDGAVGLDTVAVTVLEDRPRADAGPDTTVSVGDVIRLHGSGSDGFGRIVEWEWDIGGTGGFRLSGKDTLIKAPANPVSAYPCILRATDDDGNTTLDTAIVTVLGDPPTVSAFGDTTVSIGDRVELRGLAADRFGTVQHFEWDIGGKGNFAKSPKDIAFFAPLLPDEGFRCVLRATDDDGQSAMDTVRIRVALDPPKVNAGPDTLVSLGDSVHLGGSATDSFGTLVKWEWDIGGTGNFAGTKDGRISLIAPAMAHPAFPCILRVTDDDGVSAVDTLRVVVSADPPLAKAQAEERAAFPGDTVMLTGRGSSDRFGKVVEWAWKIGTGAFTPQATPDLALTVPIVSASEYLVCRLRVKDDDGQVSEDSVSLRVYADTGWQSLQEAMPFGTASSSVACVFQGKLWVLTMEGNQVKVRNSRNGISWNLVTTMSMNVEAFSHFKLEAIGSTLYLMAFNEVPLEGKFANPVISSVDGITWIKQSDMPSSPKDGLAVASFAGKLWVLPGTSEDGLRSDIWSSEDGKTWTRHSASHPIPQIYGGKLEAWNGRLWYVAGGGGTETWSSADGLTWRREGVADLPVGGLYGFAITDSGTRMHLVGGQIKWEANYSKEVFSSSDGVTWSKHPSPLRGMFEASAAYFRGHLWIIHATTSPPEFWRGPPSP